MQTLVPPQELVAANVVHFPNESAEYRAARNALLVEEIELRRALERLASRRRTLPPGGEVPQDLRFSAGTGRLRICASASHSRSVPGLPSNGLFSTGTNAALATSLSSPTCPASTHALTLTLTTPMFQVSAFSHGATEPFVTSIAGK
jgi:hypothetical protein